jgi:hypothetical protein
MSTPLTHRRRFRHTASSLLLALLAGLLGFAVRRGRRKARPAPDAPLSAILSYEYAEFLDTERARVARKAGR